MLALHIVSLGCAKNQVDTERILGRLLPRDCALCARPEDADVLLVNTCAFILPARDEAREVIAELSASKAPGQRLIVCGCIVSCHRDEFAARFPAVDAWVPIEHENRIADLVDGWFPHGLAPTPGVERIRISPRHYAYLRIADGCNNACSFCTIPAIRGAYRSRPPREVLDEARELVDDGVRELILVAQDSGAYGRDRDDAWSLARLARELARIDGVLWLRLMYLHPATLSDELVEVIASEPSICKYVDLPLQHIDDTILRSMRRPGERRTRALLERIRARLPGVALRSTFIVGFPGESDAAFARLRAFVEEQRFRHVGVFTYSHEPGTAAFTTPDDVPDGVKTQRRDALMTVQQRISCQHNSKLVGTRQSVLIDTVQDDTALGRRGCDAPDVDNLVHCTPVDQLAAGTHAAVTINAAEPYDLHATVAEIID